MYATSLVIVEHTNITAAFFTSMFTIDVQVDQVHQDCIPKENMVFATEQERYAFYMQYARAPGFRSKKHKNKAMSCVYVYSKQGSSEFYKEGEKRKRTKISKRKIMVL
jgi:hypothetical protein